MVFLFVLFHLVNKQKNVRCCRQNILMRLEGSLQASDRFASSGSCLLISFFFVLFCSVLFCFVLFVFCSIEYVSLRVVSARKKNKFPRACCCSMSAKPVTCSTLKLPNWGKKNWCKNCRGKKKADKCERRTEWLKSQQVVQMAKPQPKRMHRKAIVETEDQVQESSHGCASWTPHAYMRKRCPQYKLLNTDKESWLRTLHKRRRLMWRPLHNSSQPETPAQPETSAQPDAPPPRPQPEASASASMDK